MDIDNLRMALIRDEGVRYKAYLCSEGFLTVGVGHNVEAVPVPGVTAVGDVISRETCEELLTEDIGSVIAQLDEALPWWRDLDDARQNVIANMAFNMGVKTLRGFVNTLAAMEAGDYRAAARGMRNSKWARQVGARAERLAVSMETGNFT